jgi:hypothetical protein
MFIFTFILKTTLKKTAKGGTWVPSKKNYALSEMGGMQRGKRLLSFGKGYAAV